MRILIDGDGCPVVDLTVAAAVRHGLECWIFCDTAHRLERPGARTFVLDQGADSVDFALVNRAEPGDLVVTQDYGLAAMCLARGAFALRQDGVAYTAENIDGLLAIRHGARKARAAGKRVKGPRKRSRAEDAAYAAALEAWIGGTEHG